MILNKLNQLGGNISTSFPHPGDRNFAQKVTRRREQTKVSEIKAVLYEVLKEISNPAPEINKLLLSIRQKSFLTDNTPEDRWLQKFGDWLANNRHF